jgi:WhiB family redox-sensing transcriptional regulator
VVRGQRWQSTREGLFDDHGDDCRAGEVAAEAGEWLDIVERSRPAWWAEAACRVAPLEITWFPSPRDADLAAAAKAVCDTCPALSACREWAIAQGPPLYGIWGGLTENERHQVRRSRQQNVDARHSNASKPSHAGRRARSDRPL